MCGDVKGMTKGSGRSRGFHKQSTKQDLWVKNKLAMEHVSRAEGWKKVRVMLGSSL